MCGLLGLYNLNNQQINESHFKKMASKINHRGPDGEGFYFDDNIALAHKRLAILDISDNGKQPMFSNDGNWVIVFNGCIYNLCYSKIIWIFR